MKLLFALVIGGIGFSFWRKRRQTVPDDQSVSDDQSVPDEAPEPQTEATPEDDEGPDPAEELRAKLAQSKAEPASDHEPAVEEAPEEAPELPKSPFDPELRRRDVHERARAELDELG